MPPAQRQTGGRARSFMLQLSLPSVSSYLAFSLCLFITGFYYYFRIVQSLNEELRLISLNTTLDDGDEDASESWLVIADKVISVVIRHRLLFYIVLNSSCALVALAGKMLVRTLFEEPLPAAEVNLQKRVFCRFVQAKLTFLIFISHRNLIEDILIWTPWLALNITSVLILELIGARLMNPFNVISNRSLRQRLLLANSVVCCAALIMATFVMSTRGHINLHYVAFMAVDCALLLLQSIHLLHKLLTLIGSANSHRAQASSHYGDLLYDILHDGLEAANYLHMIFFSQLALTYCCLFFAIQARYYYAKISVKIQKHWQQQEIINHISSYPKANEEELAKNEKCTICWMPMKSARRLPCGHVFHDFCLRLARIAGGGLGETRMPHNQFIGRWLEQDNSCAICRKQLSLSVPTSHQGGSGMTGRGEADVMSDEENALQYVLQAFSPHNPITRWWARLLFETFNDEQMVETQVGQVADMFPQLSRNTVREAVRDAGSAQLAIDALLMRVNQQGGANGGEAPPNPMGTAGGGLPIGLLADETDSTGSESLDDSLSGEDSVAGSSVESEQELLAYAATSPLSIVDDGNDSWWAVQKKQALRLSRRKYLLSSRGGDIRHLFASELPRFDEQS